MRFTPDIEPRSGADAAQHPRRKPPIRTNPKTPSIRFGVAAAALTALAAFLHAGPPLLGPISPTTAAPSKPSVSVESPPIGSTALADTSLAGGSAEKAGAAAAADRIARLILGGISSPPAPALDPIHFEAMYAQAGDAQASPAARVDALRWLGRLGTDASVAALDELLRGALPPDLALEAAAALGRSPHPEAGRRIEELLDGPDEMRRRGALRALALREGPTCLARLLSFVGDPGASDPFRSEAIAAIARLEGPEATLALQTMVSSETSADLAGEALAGLAARPFADNESYLRALLADPSVSTDVQQRVLAALSESSPDAAKLLLETAHESPSAPLRQAAIAALVQLDEGGDSVAILARRLPLEANSQARIEIYRGLALYARTSARRVDAARLATTALSEEDPRVRIHGARAVAGMIRAGAGGDPVFRFDEEFVPWLHREAERSAAQSTRRLAVEALARTSTEASQTALGDLRRSDDASIARIAEQALQLHERTTRTRESQASTVHTGG